MNSNILAHIAKLFKAVLMVLLWISGIYSCQLNAQDSDQLFTESIESKYNAVDLLNRAERLIQSDKQLALEIGNSVLENAIFSGNKELEIQSEILLAKVYAQQNLYDSAIIYFDQALKVSQEIEDDDLEASALIGLGEVYSSQMLYNKAYNNYYQALLKALKTNNTIQLSTIYNELGGFYYNGGNISDAEIYWQKAINISLEINDMNGIARLENNVGEVYRLNGEYHKALDCFTRALKINEKFKNYNWLSTNYDNIGMIYHKLGEPEKALTYLNQGITLAKHIGYAKGECTSYGSLGLYYLDNNLLDSAMHYFNLSYTLSKKIHEVNTLKIATDGLCMVFEIIGNSDSALFYHKKFKNYSDTILNTRNLTKVSLMLAQAQFENENRINEIEQRKKQNRYIIIILALGLILVIISLIFFMQRNKVQLLDLKKKNLELEKRYLNNELTNFAIHINQKNEFLTELKRLIRNFQTFDNKDQDTQISELNSLITQNLQQKDDTEDFQIHADKLNRDFVIMLNQKFPNLTPKEVQLCILLKLNLSTKEIASIKHVTPRAIKVARYRLRKKLNLPREGNISEYLNAM